MNESPMNLRKTLTINILGVGCRWTSGNMPFDTVDNSPELPGPIDLWRLATDGKSKKLRYLLFAMTANTGGYLEGNHICEVFIVIEVKAAHQDRISVPKFSGKKLYRWLYGLRMTRTAGVFLLTSKIDTNIPLKYFMLPSTYRHLIVSQNEDEVYLTLAAIPRNTSDTCKGTSVLQEEVLHGCFSP
ncbi:hypothetical protein N7530_001966 [Penicillium desertorum]|uniref:Uncharacterized protein n=1 Tax=Penicillium desertorum TaxID=1303715 RepID=A0A9X0BX73_9EURO|nr:hypothetical protein N7530_001966 [Penicillium desertorum]